MGQCLLKGFCLSVFLQVWDLGIEENGLERRPPEGKSSCVLGVLFLSNSTHQLHQGAKAKKEEAVCVQHRGPLPPLLFWLW